MSGRLPEWLRARLGDQGGERSARAGVCGWCKREVLRGMDADRCAAMAVVDAYEIDELGEVIALLRGMTTFDLVLMGGKFELYYRGVTHIRRPRTYPVLAEHDCAYVHPAAANTHPMLARFDVQISNSDIAPF